MNRNNTTANFDMSQMLMDNMLILFAYALSCLTYGLVKHSNLSESHLWLFFIFAVIFTLTMSILRMYNITTFYYTDRIITQTLKATLVTGMSLGTLIFLYKSVESSRLLFIFFCVFSYVLVTLSRIINRILRSAKVGNGYVHIIFIGNNEMYERYENYIAKTAMKVKVDRLIEITDPILNTPEVLREILIRHSSNEVIIGTDLSDSRNEHIGEVLKLCDELGTTLRVIMDIYETPNSHHFLSSLGPLPVITYHSVSFDKVQLFIKAAIDIIGATVGLIVTLPIMLVAAICIKLDSPGPILFRQKRAGRNGKVFEIYKFRSMYIDAESHKKDLLCQNKIGNGLMFKVANDPRITRVGAFIRKSSIDELPQFINVLKRDMSLVGTRPPTLDEVEKYAPDHWRRISIMPGITGMWQVSGRSTITNFEEVVSLDKKYIDNWSIGLDIMILFRTVRTLITKHGAI